MPPTSTRHTQDDASFPAQRRVIILKRLKQQGAASIHELADEIGVSTATVRRDLDYLADQNYLERTHGGAILNTPHGTTFEAEYDIRSATARAEKEAIGMLAAKRLRRGQSVIFDSSSTVLEAARVIAQRNLPITAVTNDLTIAALLSQANAVQLIIPGGSLRPYSTTLIGEPGHTFLSGLNIDVALIGIHALVDGWLSDTSIEVTNIKQQMIRVANYIMVLADASKFENPAFRNVCSVDDIDEIITDGQLNSTIKAELDARSVTVSIAPNPSS